MHGSAARGTSFLCRVDRWRKRRSLCTFFSGMPLLAQVLLRWTRTPLLQSTTFYLQQHDLPSSWYTAPTVKTLPEDTGHLPAISLGQCCLNLQWDSHMTRLCSLLLQGSSSQSRLCSLSPSSNSQSITYTDGDGIPSTQRPQSIKLLKKMPNGEVCLRSLISLHCRASLNLVMIIGITREPLLYSEASHVPLGMVD